MATPIEMPRLGNTVEECLLAKWRKQKGDRVAEGEVIADIETDKATFEIAAPTAGTLLDLFFDEGDLVPVLTHICVIGEPGEASEPFRPRTAAASTPAAPRERADAPAAPAPEPPGEMRLSPRARRFAQEHDFHPETAAGSGPAGRVLEADLKSLYSEMPRVSSLARRQMQEPGSGIGGMILARDLGQPAARMSSLRERIARRVRESLASTAQYTLHSSADATGLLRLRRKIKENRNLPDINVGDLVLFCTIQALVEMPELNAELVDGKLRRHSSVHLGFACDTPRGLMAPVIRNSEKLLIGELALRVKQLTAQAVNGSIAPDDLTGATFTVSNLGSLGIESFTPILNPPQVAILGVNAIQLRPIRREGAIEFVEHIGLSLTCDHQVIDGAPGARFLALVKRRIENIAGDLECTI
ncbi:MAG: dihydrolipoamide acetyltransferase family protein [Bryobacterales bacterium]|nr:dihydrolipoamide acetyltransferase family protein [Bryobacterales bacterium]